MKHIVKCISSGGIFQDAWGNLIISLGSYSENETYIMQRGMILKQLLSQAELMEQPFYEKIGMFHDENYKKYL